MFKYEKPGILTLAGNDLREFLGPAETQYFFVAPPTIPPDHGTMAGTSDITVITNAGVDPTVMAIDPNSVQDTDVLLQSYTATVTSGLTASHGGHSWKGAPLSTGLSVARGALTSAAIPVDVSLQTPGTLIIHPESPLAAGDYLVTVPAPGQEIDDLTPAPDTKRLAVYSFTFTVPGEGTPTPKPTPTRTPTPTPTGTHGTPTPTPTHAPGVAISLNNGVCIADVAPGEVIHIPLRVKANPAAKLCTAQFNVSWTNKAFKCNGAGVVPRTGYTATGGNGCKKGGGEAFVKLIKDDCSTAASTSFYVADLSLTAPAEASSTTPFCVEMTYPNGPALYDADGLPMDVTASQNTCFSCDDSCDITCP